MPIKKSKSEIRTDELESEWESYGLFNEVKEDYYHKYKNASDLLYDCMGTDEIIGREPKHKTDFISAVIMLYLDLMPKIKLIKSTKEINFKDLHELKPYVTGDKHPSELGFKRARQLFVIMREMIETLGITKFETEKFSPEATAWKESIED